MHKHGNLTSHSVGRTWLSRGLWIDLHRVHPCQALNDVAGGHDLIGVVARGFDRNVQRLLGRHIGRSPHVADRAGDLLQVGKG